MDSWGLAIAVALGATGIAWAFYQVLCLSTSARRDKTSGAERIDLAVWEDETGFINTGGRGRVRKRDIPRNSSPRFARPARGEVNAYRRDDVGRSAVRTEERV